MKTLNIGILGGSGFVGHALCARLAKDGHNLTVFTRHPSRCKDLMVLPTLSLEELDAYSKPAVIRKTAGLDVVINLVGILNESGHDGSGFKRAHVDITKNVIAACQENRIPRLLHMAALNADAKHGQSFYLKTKGEALDLVHRANSIDLHVTSFCPSVIYGKHDAFLNQFAKLLRFSPGIMLLPSAQASFAPIWVEDVVECMSRSLNIRETFGKSYELAGPRVYTLKTLVKYIATLTHTRRWIIGLGQGSSSFVASIMEYLPGKPYSRDNHLSALTPSVAHDAFPAVFGLKPLQLEFVVPSYLGPNHYEDHYTQLRAHFGRET